MGTLVHPYFGTLTVALTSLHISESATEKRMWRNSIWRLWKLARWFFRPPPLPPAMASKTPAAR